MNPAGSPLRERLEKRSPLRGSDGTPRRRRSIICVSLRAMRPLLLALGVGAAVLLGTSGEARANGRFPAANQLVIAPNDPSFLVLRTTFGLLFSHDGGESWDWVCEKAVGIGNSSDPAMGIMSSNAVVAATFDGLAVSSDVGCSWSFANVGKQFVDMVVRRTDPHTALAASSAYVDASDAGDVFANNVFVTTNDGASWAPYGTSVDPSAILQTIEVAASDPHRVYVSGARTGAGGASEAVLYASADDGAHWAAHVIPLETGETAPFIAAVDPTSADRVYVRIKGNTGSRLLVTDDGGVTFRTAFKGSGEMLGFALSPDGAKVYLGGPNDGLLVASKTDLVFAARSKVQVQCLTATADALYACSNEASGFVVGVSKDDGATFTPKFHLACVRGTLACPPTSSTAQCAADLPALLETLGGGLACDAGATPAPVDGSTSADGGNADAPGSGSSGCGCGATSTSRGALAGDAAMLVAALALLPRARRRAARRKP